MDVPLWEIQLLDFKKSHEQTIPWSNSYGNIQGT